MKYATDITQQVAARVEAIRISAMVENSPVNIIYADRDLKIRYMNPMSSKTLQDPGTISADQSFAGHRPVDRYLSQRPIDQRRLLGNDKNLPHRARIGVGPETLDLQVCGIYDKDRNCTGYMLNWEVITARVATEKQVLESAEREKQAAAELKQKVDSILKVVTAASEGDLTQEITVLGSDAVGLMGQGLSKLIGNLRTGFAAIGQNAQSLASASEELSSNSQQMSANAEETSAQAKVVSTQYRAGQPEPPDRRHRGGRDGRQHQGNCQECDGGGQGGNLRRQSRGNRQYHRLQAG